MKLKRYFAIIAIFAVTLLSACGQGGINDALNYEVEDFEFTNQNGEQVGLSELEGKVWVADFIFTNCDTVCLPMTSNMKRLQTMAAEEGIENIHFVSFSVDPLNDKPDVLKTFADQYEANYDSWNFLTGYEQKVIEDFALNSFKAIVQKPKNEDQVIHDTKFYLVNQDGLIQKYYDGVTGVPYEEIINDIKTLQ
ncbi:SCO family protein [Cytobacillus gottheilii]|uniref:SCO family protein n=1 Tax=Cytobacillus gottheilii TaxID=859144 RepID=UPI0021495530